ncbi:Hypp19 [Branchiostoma lanceolatum]|uniref:Hypp19 protein n=1 Tax=Branchiostoma lanceolatum TaxID=7740 RepID=A0A8J9V621_BRALA|nr:Hypp19 [Branchiostoma lanceolatum]
MFAINEGIEDRAKAQVCVAPTTPLFISSSLYLTRPGAIGELDDFRFADMEHKVTNFWQPITAETRALANYVISGYLSPADRVDNIVNTFYESFMAGNINIGVHLRLQEGHVQEMNFFKQKIPKLQNILQIVHRVTNDAITANTGKEIRVFLASDTDEAIDVFKAEFGDNRVLNIHAVRGQDMSDRLHHKDSSRLLGEQVLTDVLLLAKCDFLVHDESSVAALAYYYNTDIRSYFVSGDPSDHRRLNAQPRFEADDLFRHAVARVTSNILVPPGWRESSLLIGLTTKWHVLWGFLNSDLPTEDVMCYYKNVKWSKCYEEFQRSEFAKNSDLRALMDV